MSEKEQASKRPAETTSGDETLDKKAAAGPVAGQDSPAAERAVQEKSKDKSAAGEGEKKTPESSDADASRQPDGFRGKRRSGKSMPAGIAYIKSTFNNTLVSITDIRGNVISWGSAGRSGFKGSRKSTAFSATMVAQDAARQAIAKGMHEVEVRIQGAGAGRESAARALQSAGMSISGIKDITPIPHNGCRPRKRRRV